MARWRLRRVAIAVLIALAPPAYAVQADVGFGVGAEYSDNIGLAPPGSEEDAWVGLASVQARLAENTADAELRAVADLQYRDYQEGGYDDEFVFSLDALGTWTLIPGRLNWMLEDYFDQASVDVFAAPSPDNRQDTNVLSTGPESRWRLSPSQSVIAGARYGNFYFEESDADSDRLSGYGRWVYAMSSRRDVSANVEATAVNYFDDDFSDYRRLDGFLRLTNRWSRSTLEADAGSSAIRRDDADDVNGFLGRVGFHMELNSYSGLDAYVTHQYTDSGHDILTTAGRDGAVGVINEQINGDVFYNRHSEIGYHWQGVRTSLEFSGAVRDEDYEITPNDRRYEQVTAGLGYELSPTLRVGVSAAWQEADYSEVDQVNTDRNAGLRVTYQINSRIAAVLAVMRTQRDSNVAEAEYEENRALIHFGYERGLGPEPQPVED